MARPTDCDRNGVRNGPKTNAQARAQERVSRLDEALRDIAVPHDEAIFHTAFTLANVRCFHYMTRSYVLGS